MTFQLLLEQVDFSKYLLVSIMSNIFSFISKKATEMQTTLDMMKQVLIIYIHTFSLDGASLSNCRLEYGNAIFYPETEYESKSKVRIFNDLMAYAMRKNDYNTGRQLNLANYNSLFVLIYFDLTYQSEKVTRNPKQLIFRYSQRHTKFRCTCCCSL